MDGTKEDEKEIRRGSDYCATCKNHIALQQQVNFNFEQNKERMEQYSRLLANLDNKQIAANSSFSKKLKEADDALQIKINETNEQVGNRIPIVHAIVAIGSVITILSLLIGMQVSSNNTLETELDKVAIQVIAARTIIDGHMQSTERFNVIMDEIRRLREEATEAATKAAIRDAHKINNGLNRP